MAQQRPRLPFTVEDAIVQAAAAIGWLALAGSVGKSEAWLRKCADPDDDAHHLHIRSGLAIDATLILAGHEPVFRELFAALAARELSERARIEAAMHDKAAPAPPSPQDRFFAAVRESGDVAAALEAARADGMLSPAERSRIAIEAMEASRAYRRMARACAEPAARGKS